MKLKANKRFSLEELELEGAEVFTKDFFDMEACFIDKQFYKLTCLAGACVEVLAMLENIEESGGSLDVIDFDYLTQRLILNVARFASKNKCDNKDMNKQMLSYSNELTEQLQDAVENYTACPHLFLLSKTTQNTQNYAMFVTKVVESLCESASVENLSVRKPKDEKILNDRDFLRGMDVSFAMKFTIGDDDWLIKKDFDGDDCLEINGKTIDAINADAHAVLMLLLWVYEKKRGTVHLEELIQGFLGHRETVLVSKLIMKHLGKDNYKDFILLADLCIEFKELDSPKWVREEMIADALKNALPNEEHKTLEKLSKHLLEAGFYH